MKFLYRFSFCLWFDKQLNTSHKV